MTYTLAVLITTCVPISIIDCRKYIVPDILVVLLFVLMVTHDLLFNRTHIPFAVLATLASFCLFFCIYRMYGGLGFGDVKLSVALGYSLGFPLEFVAFSCASILAIVYAVAFLRNKSRSFRISFAPFLSAGAALMVLVDNAKTVSLGY